MPQTKSAVHKAAKTVFGDKNAEMWAVLDVFWPKNEAETANFQPVFVAYISHAAVNEVLKTIPRERVFGAEEAKKHLNEALYSRIFVRFDWFEAPGEALPWALGVAEVGTIAVDFGVVPSKTLLVNILAGNSGQEKPEIPFL